MAYFRGNLDASQEQDKAAYLAFFEVPDSPYDDLVRRMMDQKQSRLTIRIDHLRLHDMQLATKLVASPAEQMPLFNMALRDFVEHRDAAYLEEHPDLWIGVKGHLGSHHVTPRGLSARLLGKLVIIQGIVTKCSLVRPKVHKSVHYCPSTGKQVTREYHDATSFVAAPTGSTYPTEDEEGNVLETEFGLSTYRDHQTIGVQEVPETAPPGQLPRSVDVILTDDLVDLMKPGDRVQITGTYRGLPGSNGGMTTGVFRTVIVANSVTHTSQEVAHPLISEDDVAQIRKISERKDVLDILTRSVAPSIYGHDIIKRGLLCLMLGGNEKNLASGTHLRGDINMMLIGDPSTAKSQVLRFALHTAPLAIATTGRGSSGVGLTAAVTSDQETGERRLEAGAMVLADRGIVCIDEFDKMSDGDRVAIHEVMEQQTVTIAKAGIHTTLNARCAVLAAANPIYGQYNRTKTPMENIALPDSLLSRFDLLFVVLDIMDPKRDQEISEHVLRMHRYRAPNEQQGQVRVEESSNMMVTDEREEAAAMAAANKVTSPWEPFNPMLHGNMKAEKGKKQSRPKLLTIAFLKKYLFFAKQQTKPKLTEEACKLISATYSDLRSSDRLGEKSLPITARSLETIIRIATAVAKARLSKKVLKADAEEAVRILYEALFNSDLLTKKLPSGKRKRDQDDDDDDEEDDDDDDDTPKKRTPAKSKSPEKKSVTPAKRTSATSTPSKGKAASTTGSPQSKKGSPRKASPTKKTTKKKGTKKRKTDDPFAYESEGEEEEDEEEEEEEEEVPMDDAEEELVPKEATLTEERYALFRQALLALAAHERRQSIETELVRERIAEFAAEDASPEVREQMVRDVDAGLARLADDGKIMVTGGILYLF